MEISVNLIKELREKTGAGMADCKNALIESNGDINKAIEYLRKKGAAMAAKRADKIAKEGAIKSAISNDKKSAVIIEVNCETDFVSKGEGFQKFAQDIADAALIAGTDDVNQILNAKTSNGLTVQDTIDEMMGKVGEKIELKRVKYLNIPDGFISSYIHFGSKLGALVGLKGNYTEQANELGRKIAMQVVAMNPIAIDRAGVNPEVIEKEREIYYEQAKSDSKKPPEIIERIVKNKIEKFYQENCLLEQEYIQDQNVSVGEFIKKFNNTNNTTLEVVTIVRFQLG
jgi:elongation factor Ts